MAWHAKRTKRVHFLRVVRKYGGWQERFILAYFYGYIASAFLGLLLLILVNAPSEIGYAFTFAAIFGISGLFGVWFGTWMTCVPVFRAFTDTLAPGNPDRGLFALHLTYLERYSVNGRFPRIVRFAFAAAILNAVFTVASVLVGYAWEWAVPGISPTTVLVGSGVWIIAAYGSLAVVSIRVVRAWSRKAMERGFDLRVRPLRRTIR